jgi:polysaccharide biosynthesis transport protein
MTSNTTLNRVLQAARRRYKILLVCIILVPAAAVAVSVTRESQYTAEATLLFRDSQFDQKLFGSTFVPNSGDPAREAATNLTLVSLERVSRRTTRRFRGLTEDDIRGAVKASSEGQADVVTIEATWTSARMAARLANAFAREYIAFRRRADRAKIREARTLLRAQLAQLTPGQRRGGNGRALRQRLGQLNVLVALQTGNAELAQRAEPPDEPSSPKPLRDGALGLLLGLLLGAALVALAEAFDRRLRDPAEVEQLLHAPVLAALPESEALRDGDPTLANVPEAEREAFRMLRGSLRYFTLSSDIRSVLITSADSGDGKSTVAWGLAVASASAGSRTLLIEADLRRPTFAKRYDLKARHGLTSVLTGDARSEDAIVHLALSGGDSGRVPERTLDVLAAGPLPPNPADLVESQQMADLLTAAEANYDLVVVDTPPASTVSDTMPLVRLVGRVIVVSRLGTSSRDRVRPLRHQLDALGASVLGIVINSADRGDGYGYGYSYGYEPATQAGARNEPQEPWSPNGHHAESPRVAARD